MADIHPRLSLVQLSAKHDEGVGLRRDAPVEGLNLNGNERRRIPAAAKTKPSLKSRPRRSGEDRKGERRALVA